MALGREDLKHAVELARAGDWHAAHAIVQLDETGELACWLHACLHKIEGDEANACYWYRRSGGRAYDDYSSPDDELRALMSAIS